MLTIEYRFEMLMDELEYSTLVDQLCLTNFHQVIVESENESCGEYEEKNEVFTIWWRTANSFFKSICAHAKYFN